MPAFNLDILLDATHLFTFVTGAAVGAAGTYLADKATDKRRNVEHVDARRERFRDLRSHMPELFAEMKSDLADPKLTLVRDLVVVPNARIGFTPAKATLVYFEDQHDNLVVKLDAIARAGFAMCLSDGRPQRYQLGDDFAFLIQNER